MRLNRYIARSGVCSRRQADKRIAAGRVQINGVKVTDLATQVDPAHDQVMVDGQLIAPSALLVITYHKPVGEVCSRDGQGAPTVFERFHDHPEHDSLIIAGRLDKDSEGLLILTTDGELVQQLTHPSHEVSKRYQLWFREPLTAQQEEMARQGIADQGEHLSVDKIRARHQDGELYTLECTIHEGKNRHLRRLFAALGADVVRLKRLTMGEYALGDLPAGQYVVL